MRKLSVSIDISSSLHSLAELSAITGVPAGGSSHDKGSPRGRRGTWTVSILRIDSKTPGESPIKNHLEDLLSRFELLEISKRLDRKDGIRIDLNIGVMFSTASVSIEIDDQQMLTLGKNGIKLEISAYPSQEDNGDSRHGEVPGISVFNLKPSAIT